MDDRWRPGPAGPRHRRQPDFAFVLPSLAVGEYVTTADIEWLAATHGIGAIINLQDADDFAAYLLDVDALAACARARAVAFHHFPVPDCDPRHLLVHLDRIIAVLADLEARDVRTYLHCSAGLNRAPTVAIAYLHVQHGLPLATACAVMKARRACGPYMELLRAHVERPR